MNIRARLLVAIVLCLGTVLGASSTGSAQTARQKRAAAQAQRAKNAAELNALVASDSQLEQALTDLDSHLQIQDSAVQAARQATEAARIEVDNARSKLGLAEQELNNVKDQLKARAVAAYMDPFSGSRLDTLLSAGNMDELTRRQEFLRRVANEGQLNFDKLRSLREDLQIQEATLKKAESVVQGRQGEAESLYNDLLQTKQEREAAKANLEARIARAKVEDDYYAAIDGQLSADIRKWDAAAAALAASQRGVNAASGAASGLAFTPSSGLQWPASGPVTSGFGYRWGRLHAGIDIAPPYGSPIYAAGSGVVSQAGWNGGYGNSVIISHGNSLSTLYGHQSSVVVSVGQLVSKGQLIGYVGSTGNSTGPHLHFETRIDGVAQNPRNYLP